MGYIQPYGTVIMSASFMGLEGGAPWSLFIKSDCSDVMPDAYARLRTIAYCGTCIYTARSVRLHV